MIKTLTEEELSFCECLYNPECFSESLFPNVDNLGYFELGEFSEIRLGQIPLLSGEYYIGEDPNLTKKQNFQKLVGAGTGYLFGGRNFGKSLVFEKLDIVHSLIVNEGYPMGLTSYDAVHIRGVLDPIINVFINHPLLSDYKVDVKRSPAYFISTKSSSYLEGINMNIAHKDAGAQFFGKHLKKLFMEEASFETEEVYNKRIDSRHEIGCIERLSGMTSFTKYSPAGKIFNDTSLKPKVLNLPQYINPHWGEEEKENAIRKYSGENSIGYRVFVKGQVIEHGISVFDMQRVRENYLEGKKLKIFEITKETFSLHEEILILERPHNADQLFICADIGETAPTEILVFIQVGEIYKLLHNITLHNLTSKEQEVIFKYLGRKLNANLIGLDTTDGTGRAIYRGLEEFFGKDHLVYCSFNEKIPVEYDRDERDNIVYKVGQPLYIEEFVSEWSVKHLKDLLYHNKIKIPEDSYKIDVQLNSVVATPSQRLVKYECIHEENHAFQALQVFSITEWSKAFDLIKPVSKKKFSKIGA